MSFWHQLSDDDLFFILESEKLKEIYKKFKEKIEYEDWLVYARQHYNAQLESNKISQSLFASLNDAPSYALMTLLSIIGTITLKVLALSLLTAGFATLMLAAGIVYFVASYKEQQKETKAAQKFFDFATIKMKCADELIARQKHTLAQSSHHHLEIMHSLAMNPARQCKEFEYKNKDKILKLKPALGAGLLTATMLFGTYYLGVSAIITAFGLSVAAATMLGPIGLGIAIGVAIAIGIYCGYKHYQSTVNADKIEKLQNHMNEEFKHKRKECFDLHKNIRTLENHLEQTISPHSEPDLLHKKDLLDTNSTIQQRNFLLRRENMLRNKRPQKPIHIMNPPADPLHSNTEQNLRP